MFASNVCLERLKDLIIFLAFLVHFRPNKESKDRELSCEEEERKERNERKKGRKKEEKIGERKRRRKRRKKHGLNLEEN